MAILLRKNERIEGFGIANFKKLFGQYADDMDIYCKNNKNNLKEIDMDLSEFGHNTGLKINYDKTTIYRMSKNNKSKAEVYTIKEMKAVSESINVLGVTICHDRQQMIKLNYEPIIERMKGILTSWSKRNLSLVSKIQVVNALVASLFVYKMYVLPALPLS